MHVLNIPDAGRAPSNEPEPPRAQQPDKPDTQPRPRFCAYCGARWKPDTRGYCCGCGAPLARAEWPPESQEARAAATGQTRTK
jgi:predicted amidophosphoribosyltransferase